MTSRAEAREVLDVHAVEFSKTGPPRDLPRKRPPLAREALEAKRYSVVWLRRKGSPWLVG
jgi:hypothetical protein